MAHFADLGTPDRIYVITVKALPLPLLVPMCLCIELLPPFVERYHHDGNPWIKKVKKIFDRFEKRPYNNACTFTHVYVHAL